MIFPETSCTNLASPYILLTGCKSTSGYCTISSLPTSGTSATTLSGYCGCFDNSVFTSKPDSQISEGRKKKQNDLLREQLQKLPGNRKRMRF